MKYHVVRVSENSEIRALFSHYLSREIDQECNDILVQTVQGNL